MTDRLVLLRVILANPAENTPRLAFADWLEEHGTTDADRARVEFVRLWFRLKPGLRSTTKSIGQWLRANWARLWPTVAGAAAGPAVPKVVPRGRSLTAEFPSDVPGVSPSWVKVYFDRGFAERVQFGRGGVYVRFWRAFAADEPLAAFEPGHGPNTTGFVPDTISTARRADWGSDVFDRMTEFDSMPDPDTKVYLCRATGPGQLPLAYDQWHSAQRAMREIADIMTALARESNGLAAPTAPEGT